MDKLMQMAAAAGIGGGGGGGQIPQAMKPGMYGPMSENGPSGGLPQSSSGGGMQLQQLMQMAGPLLAQMGPQSKMALGQALQTPQVQQMVTQALQNPQMLAMLFDQATQGMRGGGFKSVQGMQDPMAGTDGGPGMMTDQSLNEMDMAQNPIKQMMGLPESEAEGGPEPAGGGKIPMSAEQELEAIYQMMGKGSDGLKSMAKGEKKSKSSPKKDDGEGDADD